MIVVVSGLSGAGKTSVVKEVLARDRTLAYSVSWTTRRPRDGETAGVDYHFVTPEEFNSKVKAGGFAEWKSVYGNFYGTPLESVYSKKNILLEIDIQGAIEVKKRFPQVHMIYIMPPSRELLEQRLISRETETEEERTLRLGKAAEELEGASAFDFFVENDDVSQTAKQLNCLIMYLSLGGIAKPRSYVQMDKLKKLKDEFSSK